MLIIEQIKKKTNIVSIISEYIPLKKVGHSFNGNCPFHQDTKQSLFIYPQRQSWRCFGECNAGGDVVAFIMRMENINFSEAVKLLAKRVGIAIDDVFKEGESPDEINRILQSGSAHTNLGEKIRAERLTLGLSKAALARAAAISAVHLGRIERGERQPKAAVLSRISGALGKTSDYFLNEVKAGEVVDTAGPERLPPSDLDAEETVIGALLLDGEVIFKIADFLRPADFYYEQNQWLYDACLSLYQRNEAINQITIAEELSRQGKLEVCGGAPRLSHLISICPTLLNIEHHARIVYQLSVMRQLITTGARITAIGYENSPNVEDSLKEAESVLFKLRRGQSPSDITPIRQVLGDFFEQKLEIEESGAEQSSYIPSGISVLDEFLGGFQRSDLVIVAGRPSMGKSSFVLNIAHNAAVEHKACIALFSLEMARETLMLRLLSSQSGINNRRIRLGQFSEKEEVQLLEAAGVLAEARIYIDDTPMLSLPELRSKTLQINYEYSIDMVIIDYLQLIHSDWGRETNRVEEISYITRSLKALAREVNAPVLVTSQLGRAVERRASHVPQLSDLRESSSIEQDADVVLFIYREEYYYTKDEWKIIHPEIEFPGNQANIVIAKNRNGPIGVLTLGFKSGVGRFESLEVENLLEQNAGSRPAGARVTKASKSS